MKTTRSLDCGFIFYMSAVFAQFERGALTQRLQALDGSGLDRLAHSLVELADPFSKVKVSLRARASRSEI